jgi:hypothetical protein
MRGVWILIDKNTGSSYAFSSLPVVFTQYPKLLPYKNSIYRHKKIEAEGIELRRVQMLRPEDVR